MRRESRTALRAARLPRIRQERRGAGHLPRSRQLGAARRARALRRPRSRRRHGHARHLLRRARPRCTSWECAVCASTTSSASSIRSPTTTTARSSRRSAPLGWHVVLYFEPADLAEKRDFFSSLGVPIVVDHMGRPDVTKPVDDPELRAVPRFMRENRGCLDQGQLSRSPQRVGFAPLHRRRPLREGDRRGVPRPRALGHRLAASEHEEGDARRRHPRRLRPPRSRPRHPCSRSCSSPIPPLSIGADHEDRISTSSTTSPEPRSSRSRRRARASPSTSSA